MQLNKNKFVESAGNEKLDKPNNLSLRAPARVKVYDPSEKDQFLSINIAIMAMQGYGKTFFLWDCLKRGLRVLIVNTDAGYTGPETILAQANKEGKKELLQNLRVITIEEYDDFVEFCEEPTKFYPDFYKFHPQVISWEGFSAFQHNAVGEKTAEIYSDNLGKKEELKSSRDEGLRFEQQDWGVIRNASGKALNKFLKLSIAQTNLLRVVTVHEDIISEQFTDANNQKQTREVLAERPLIQGATKKLFTQAFALCFRATKKAGEFIYQTKEKPLGFNKKRGIDLPDEFPASGEKVLAAIEAAYEIKIG